MSVTKTPKDQAEQRVNIAEAEYESNDSGEQSSGKRPREIALERVEGSLTPSQKRADAGEQQQEERDWNVHFVEERRAHADFATLHPFRKDWEERAPQHGEARGQQNEIVEQKARFARDQRIELIVAAQVIAIFPVCREADQER